jgi:tetratricopeptide (TPR) repeat protein
MRKKNRRMYRIVIILILVMFVGSCSNVLDRVKSGGKPKKEKSSGAKLVKPAPLPTPLPPLTPKAKSTPIPKSTSKPVLTPIPELTPTPEPAPSQSIIQQGIAYREAGDIKKAITSFEQALKIEPGNAEAAKYLEEARNELDELITSHLNNGIKYFNQDALEDAIREWDKVLELDPSHQEALKYKKEAQRRLDALQNQ